MIIEDIPDGFLVFVVGSWYLKDHSPFSTGHLLNSGVCRIFKPVEFDGLRIITGLNSFTFTPLRWIEKISARENQVFLIFSITDRNWGRTTRIVFQTSS